MSFVSIQQQNTISKNPCIAGTFNEILHNLLCFACFVNSGCFFFRLLVLQHPQVHLQQIQEYLFLFIHLADQSHQLPLVVQPLQLLQLLQFDRSVCWCIIFFSTSS
jgi:hypothetical protein